MLTLRWYNTGEEALMFKQKVPLPRYWIHIQSEGSGKSGSAAAQMNQIAQETILGSDVYAWRKRRTSLVQSTTQACFPGLKVPTVDANSALPMIRNMP